MTPQEVLEAAKNLTLVDVRETTEYTGHLGHILNTKLIVLSTLSENLKSIPKDKTIVFICRSGSRSANAATVAKNAGFTNVYNMAGGMLLWNELKLPIEK